MIAIMLATMVACQQPERLSDSSPLDPRRSTPAVNLKPLTLEPMLLKTHADYDEWEKVIIDRSGPTLAYLLYKEALTHQRGNRLTFVRWLLLSHRPELADSYREPLQAFAQSLSKAPKTDGDIKYLLGFLAWQRMGGKPAGKESIPTTLKNAALVDTVTKNWGDLVTEHPDWIGPYGLNTQTIAKRLAALKKSVAALSMPTTEVTQDKTAEPSEKQMKFMNAVDGFYRLYEDQGPKKACQRIEGAIQIDNDPTKLGDAYAHCALFRDNPHAALDQLERMLNKQITGGFPSILQKLNIAAKSDERLAGRLSTFTPKLKALLQSNPEYATRCGLTLWFQ